MIRVAHIGPPRARTGGPAGYLDQLYQAAQGQPGSEQVLFPPQAAVHRAPAPGAKARVRRALGSWKRRLLGPPKFWRPDDAALHEPRGVIHQNMLRVQGEVIAAAQESIRQASQPRAADAAFVHDLFLTRYMLDHRVCQQVWMLVHGPFPFALFHAWSYGAPEKDWREIAALPDVRWWIDWELQTWRDAERVILPCPEAIEGYAAVDDRFAELLPKADFLLTGASGTSTPATADRQQLRRRFGLPENTPVGLFLGRPQPYRGLDILLDAVQALNPRAVSGIVAFAGPPREAIPRHPRLLPLGHVADVSGLLAAVDFVINVNRFCLFDLSTIEAAEAGKPMLLHAVGGNKTFRDLGVGCLMFDELSPWAVAGALAEMFALPDDTLESMGRESRACYDAHLTRQHLWRRHLEFYQQSGKSLVAAN